MYFWRDNSDRGQFSSGFNAFRDWENRNENDSLRDSREENRYMSQLRDGFVTAFHETEYQGATMG